MLRHQRSAEQKKVASATFTVTGVTSHADLPAEHRHKPARSAAVAPPSPLESADGAAGRVNGEPTEAAAEYLMTIRYMHGEGQPVIAARLAERLGVSAATVSEMVTRLVARAW